MGEGKTLPSHLGLSTSFFAHSNDRQTFVYFHVVFVRTRAVDVVEIEKRLQAVILQVWRQVFDSSSWGELTFCLGELARRRLNLLPFGKSFELLGSYR